MHCRPEHRLGYLECHFAHRQVHQECRLEHQLEHQLELERQQTRTRRETERQQQQQRARGRLRHQCWGDRSHPENRQIEALVYLR